MEIRTIPAADIELPNELEPLRRLCYNLWWSWNPRARRLFSHINPEVWARYRNPVELLLQVEPHQWRQLVENETFMSLFRSVLREFDRYLNNVAQAYFPKNYPNYTGGPIAYFSCEYGVHESIHVYSGGLGVLSGDTCKAASDFGLPFIAVGLLYKNGYFSQEIEPDGRQQHMYPHYDFTRLPLLPAQGLDGGELIVDIDFPGRKVYAKAWVIQVGRVPILLLDTDIDRNDPADRPISGQLYVGGREMRLCQEILLGIGGARMLRALKIEPGIWHMNEGHSALLSYERIRVAMKEEKLSFEKAAEKIRANAVFTTHTPVPAGHEAFHVDMVRKYGELYSKATGVPAEKILQLGLDRDNHHEFSLTVLAFRTATYYNAVSALHGKVSNEMWHHLWPGDKEAKKKVGYVTNGVHTQTWLGYPMWELFDRHLGMHWVENLMDEMYWSRHVPSIPDNELWEVHQMQKQDLVRYARRELRTMFARHGCSPDELRSLEQILNPHALTIGFARRFATYKRATMVFDDYNRLRALLKNPERPVQIIFAGKAHPADKEGQALVQRIFQIAYHSDLRGHIVLLENYSMRTARMLVQGVDIWMNTPRRPREASGTSGQKAPINGGINFSILDGWWCESYKGDNGWAIGDGSEHSDHAYQDRMDSASLYETLEKHLIPLYYDRNGNGLPLAWIQRMKASMATVVPRFSAARMIRDYITQAYLPHAPKTRKVEEAW